MRNVVCVCIHEFFSQSFLLRCILAHEVGSCWRLGRISRDVEKVDAVKSTWSKGKRGGMGSKVCVWGGVGVVDVNMSDFATRSSGEGCME